VRCKIACRRCAAGTGRRTTGGCDATAAPAGTTRFSPPPSPCSCPFPSLSLFFLLVFISSHCRLPSPSLCSFPAQVRVLFAEPAHGLSLLCLSLSLTPSMNIYLSISHTHKAAHGLSHPSLPSPSLICLSCGQVCVLFNEPAHGRSVRFFCRSAACRKNGARQVLKR
jgi:hypothetical protein